MKIPRVFMVSSGYEGCNYVRMYLPAIHNGFSIDKPSKEYSVMTPGEFKYHLDISDVIVFHRPENVAYLNLIKMLKRDGKKIVVDNDDTYKLDDIHPLANFQPNGDKIDRLAERDSMMDEAIRLSDMATTSTEFLAEEYRRINKNVVVLANCVDQMDWEEPVKNPSKKVRVGLVGSVSMEYDYLHLKEEMTSLSKRDDVELVIFGLHSKKSRLENPLVTRVFHEEYSFWDSINIEHVPWCRMKDYQDVVHSLQLDIMLIPRKDNYFNRCKSNLKFLEASMLEIPVIAQSFPQGPYEEIKDEVTGLLVKDNKDWNSKIKRMIADKELRERIGKNAKQYVINKYNINNNYHKWADAYASLF